jgi:Hemerythrin HHE cation binding domain
MDIVIPEITSLTFSSEDPSSLGELLTAGKKVPPDATALLMQDHAEVSAMFLQHEEEQDEYVKTVLANKICLALTVHAQIEESTFYPEAGRALEDDDVIAEAVDEHNEMKEEIAEIVEGVMAGKPLARPVKMLMQIVEHHVEEEETEMFPDVRQTDIDLYELGARLAAQRAEALLGMRRQAAQAAGLI